MPRILDLICRKCGGIALDVILGMNEEYPYCSECGEQMDFLPTRLNADTHFPGSHNSEYNPEGRKYVGDTKRQLDMQLKNMKAENKYVEAVKKATKGQVKVKMKQDSKDG